MHCEGKKLNPTMKKEDVFCYSEFLMGRVKTICQDLKNVMSLESEIIVLVLFTIQRGLYHKFFFIKEQPLTEVIAIRLITT